MQKKTRPTVEELDRSLNQITGGARASGRIDNVDAHSVLVQETARDGLLALNLLPHVRTALGQRASKASKDKVLAQIAELTGEPHQEEPAAKEE